MTKRDLLTSDLYNLDELDTFEHFFGVFDIIES